MAGDKYYKQAKEEQRKFLESEEEMDRLYKEKLEKEREFEYLNSLFREDSTREYNPVEHYKDGGLVSRGQGRVIKTKKTKMY
jgi:RIO-like serine/threonine protein kinase